MIRLGDIYEGKGYYRLPMLSTTRKSTNYRLKISLDRTSRLSNDLRSAEPVQGLQFSFGYFPGTQVPVDLNPQDHPDLIEWLD
jgi:hypothetical protein